MHKRTSFMIIGLAGAISMLATNAYAKSMSAEDFVQKASIANEFEIDSSKIALDKSQNGNVKKFAQRMVDDHTKAGDNLEAALQSSDEQIQPAEQLDDKHQQLLDRLKDASSDTFDRQYIAMQTDAHKNAVKLFNDYANNGKDEALKDFAAQTLPTLKEHLKHVQKLHASAPQKSTI